MSRKIVIVLLSLLMFLNITASAISSDEAFLNSAERKLFNTTYQKNTISKRLSRLERSIYGEEKKNLSTNIRINNLKKVPTLKEEKNTQIPAVAHQPEKQKKKQQTMQKQPQIEITLPPTPQEKIQDIGYYPAIDRLEQQVLKTTYKTEDIYPRLNRLEKAVYKKTFEDKDLAWRTDNLNATIFKEAPPREISEEEYDMNEQTLSALIGELETAVLSQTYPQENSLNRIRRLERNIYNTTYEDDSTYTRLERIVTTLEATQKPRTYEYAYPSRGFGYNSPYHTVSRSSGRASSNDMLPMIFLFLWMGLL